MQPSGYALSATRPKETLWAESALGPAKREPFVNSSIMRMLFLPHPRVTTFVNPHLIPLYDLIYLVHLPCAMCHVPYVAATLFPRAGGTGQLAEAVSYACSFLHRCIVPPRSGGSGHLAKAVSCACSLLHPSSSGPIGLPCHSEGLLFVLFLEVGTFSACTAVGAEAARAAVLS